MYKTLYLTLYNNSLRVALTSKPGFKASIYTCTINPEVYYKYDDFKMYIDAFSRKEYQEILKMYASSQKQTVVSIIKKKLQSLTSKNCIGPYPQGLLSEHVPDEWFHGCKTIINMLEFENIKGIYDVPF